MLGPDHPETLRSGSNLAVAYNRARRPAQAIPLLEKNLADRERVQGPDHPDTLISSNNLALGYIIAGRPAQAIPLFEKTLADCERALGPEHPTSKLVRNNLAWVAAQQPHGDSGRRTGKRQWFRR